MIYNFTAIKQISKSIPMEDDEIIDINQIQVNIPNSRLPIVIPFGPYCSGKTMMILRLCKYLFKRGYQIKPVRDFRPSSDKKYLYFCDKFKEYLRTIYASISTGPYGAILIEISNKTGNPICYLLDVEGNCFFDPCCPHAPYPTYINYIMYSSNPKQFIYFVEPDWGDETDRRLYVRRILENQIRFCNPRRDKSIILCNKIDKFQHCITPSGQVDEKIAFRACRNQYNGLFNIFRQDIPVLKWFQPYNVDFIPFSSGFFYQDDSGKFMYEVGLDFYPKTLWEKILNFTSRHRY